MNSAPVYFFPSRMVRIVLLAMEEILGHDEVVAFINLSDLTIYIDQYPDYNQDLRFSFEDISRLQTVFERTYGPRAGRGLSLRIGRACFKYGLREFGPELGIPNLDFRLMPLSIRLKVGSEALAGLFNQYTGQRIRLTVEEKHIYWLIECCPLCWERQADDPCCTLAVGLLQEALFWVSGGKTFLVEEKNCIACGDLTCTMVIDRTPIPL